MILTADLQELKRYVEQIAHDLGLDFYTQIFESVTSQQLNEIASYGGFPTRYPHWRFGMDYERLSKSHSYGVSKIYELVINNDPCYAYLLDSNTMTENKLIMAHVYGHNDFFKCNYWFSRTHRKMMDKMANHGTRIRRYYDRYGRTVVEDFIDACLSLEDLIDPFLPFVDTSLQAPSVMEEDEDEGQAVPRFKAKPYMENYINPPEFLQEQKQKMEEDVARRKHLPEKPEKDVLKFLMDHAPLEDWQQDVLGIIREEAYYFVPQRQTKIMNEGWASYWHSTIMTTELLTDAEVIDYAETHAGTMGSRPGVINPYKLGLELYRHIEARWDKGRFGKEYHDCEDLKRKHEWDTGAGQGREKIFEVRRVHNDVTFIDEFIDEDFAEQQQLFTFGYNKRTGEYVIMDRDYTKVKDKLIFSLTNFGLPFIYVTDANYENRGELYLEHKYHNFDLRVDWAKDTLVKLHCIWGRPVHLETTLEGSRKRFSYNGSEHKEEFIKEV